MLNSSRLTQKHQTTIPLAIRSRLGLHAGDYVGFEVDEHNQVVIKKIDPQEQAYYQSLEYTLGEWHTKNDDEAYRDL